MICILNTLMLLCECEVFSVLQILRMEGLGYAIPMCWL